MKRILVLALTALAAVALLAGPAAAQDYPPEAVGTASVSDSTVVPGQAITVCGEGWLPGSEVTLTLTGGPDNVARVLGTATVDGDGNFCTEVTIPSDLAPGEYQLRISGIDIEGNPHEEVITITIVAPADVDDPDDPDAIAVPAPTDRLVRTGLELTTGLAAAAALLGVGGAALYAARRRSRVIEE